MSWQQNDWYNEQQRELEQEQMSDAEYHETVEKEELWWQQQDHDRNWISKQLSNGSETTRKPKWAEK